MTREEEIIKRVEIYTDDAANLAEWGDGWEDYNDYKDGWEDYNDYKDVKKAFINGAKWADKTMLEKVCEWLSEIYFDSDYFRDAEDCFDNDKIIEEFKKAMEE